MIKLFVMDVDGTLTDGKIHLASNGELFKTFDVKDGYAIGCILPQFGIKTAFVTGRTSDILALRGQELSVDYVRQGISEKLAEIDAIAEELGVSREQIAYIGDDNNDLMAMQRCGVCGCPKDASADIKKIAKFVSDRNGGYGAVREFVEWLIQNQYIGA